MNLGGLRTGAAYILAGLSVLFFLAAAVLAFALIRASF